MIYQRFIKWIIHTPSLSAMFIYLTHTYQRLLDGYRCSLECMNERLLSLGFTLTSFLRLKVHFQRTHKGSETCVLPWQGQVDGSVQRYNVKVRRRIYSTVYPDDNIHQQLIDVNECSFLNMNKVLAMSGFWLIPYSYRNKHVYAAFYFYRENTLKALLW